MKKFLSTFQGSIASRKFYAELESRPFGSSLGYYFTLIFIAAIIFALFVSWNILPSVNSFAKNIGPTIVEYYPENLEVKIEDGTAYHNQEDPVFIPFSVPDSTGFEIDQSGDFPFKYALVIDTKNTFSLENFENYETMVYLSQDSLVFANESGGVEDIVPLKDIPDDFTINRQTVLSFIGDLQPLVRMLPVIVFFFIFVGGFFYYGFSLVRIILAALIIWALYRLRGLQYNFKKSYQVAIHASTLSLVLIPGLFTLFGFDLSIPFLFTVLTVIVAAIFMPQPLKADTSGLTADNG